MSTAGRALPHESAQEHVTGRALYTDDLLHRFPGLLHGWPVQAPHAHARLLALRCAGAYEVSGVVKVLTAADVRGENEVGPVRHDEPLFPDEVQFYGQAVAFVLAESEAAARAGAARVEADYAELPAILSIDEAIAHHHIHVGPVQIGRGDVERALHEAPHTLEGALQTGAQEHFYLETQAALAYRDEAGLMMVHASTQHPAETQEVVARVLGLARNQVVVQVLRMGGAFGGKEVQANAWAAVAALGAAVTGRPVRLRLARTQDMVLTGKRHPFCGRFRVGFNSEGRLLALRLALYGDAGWSLDLSEAILYRAMFHADNAYCIPNMNVTGWMLKTHKVSNTAFRGFGGPQGMLMIEEIIDRVARTLGLEPHVVRERNLLRTGDVTHYGQAIKDGDRICQIWRELKSESQFDERRAAIERFNATSLLVKRGIAITPVKFGISFTTSFLNQAGALVLLYQDGTVQVNHGGTEMGQGLHTKMQQVAAEALGVLPEWVYMMPTRTDKVPNTSATAASSGADLNGQAIQAACEALRKRLAAVAARRFAVQAEQVEFAAGQVYPLGRPAEALAFREVVRMAYLERVPLFATGYYRTPDIYFDKERGQGKPFHYFAYGAAVSEVEVDGYTGQYRLLRVDILHDAGASLNPLIDIGQIEGGFVQGMGWLTLEELVWGASGQLVTQGASTYKIPSMAEMPPDFRVRLLPRADDSGTIYGSKAVGEPPLMLALSVREALRAAVSAFGQGGPVELAAPATPEAVFWAIERMRGTAGM